MGVPLRIQQEGIELNRDNLDLILRLVLNRSQEVQALDLEPEEVQAEVVLRILKANLGAHPYSPARASLSTYLYLQVGSTLKNLRAKQQTYKKRLGEYRECVKPPAPPRLCRLVRFHAPTEKNGDFYGDAEEGEK